jgi:hypothetical protein
LSETVSLVENDFVIFAYRQLRDDLAAIFFGSKMKWKINFIFIIERNFLLQENRRERRRERRE